MKKPQRKTSSTIRSTFKYSEAYKTGRAGHIAFIGDSYHVKDLKQFGEIESLEMGKDYYKLYVDPRFDFDEAVEYARSLERALASEMLRQRLLPWRRGFLWATRPARTSRRFGVSWRRGTR